MQTLKIKLENIFSKLKKFFLCKILGKKYIRSGKCNGCGRCCQSIYVRHAKQFIKTREEFERLKTLHYFYNYLKVVDETEDGLVFECTKLNKETGKCTAYSSRPLLCRRYPMEEIFMMGGIISDNCGYSFTPIESFEEVLSKVKKKKI